MRLDVCLFQKGYSESRERASKQIKAGLVLVNGKIVTKPAYDVLESDEIVVSGDIHNYVGRGGLKLEAALRSFEIAPEGLVCADVGSSTGGFTDCLLQNGASEVYAIDSGSGQLHEKLRSDPRVHVYESLNARLITEETFGRKFDLCVMDVSFISQTVLYPAVTSLLKDGGAFVSLVKPQFEAGRAFIGKGGIVKDPKIYPTVIENVLKNAAVNGLYCQNVIRSPITGGDGNREFLAYFIYGKNGKLPYYVPETEFYK